MRNYCKRNPDPPGSEGEDLAAITRTAVKESFDRLFNGTHVFDPENCARYGCDRRPARGSRFCGCCLEDLRAGHRVVFDGREELLPGGPAMARQAFGGKMVHEWNRPRN